MKDLFLDSWWVWQEAAGLDSRNVSSQEKKVIAWKDCEFAITWKRETSVRNGATHLTLEQTDKLGDPLRPLSDGLCNIGL